MSEPSKEQIALWKEEHENVFQLDSGKGVYYFRSINFAEHEKALEITRTEGHVEADDYLVETALLFPEPTQENLARMPALFASTLSDYILDFSCLGGAEYAARRMEEERERTQNIKSVMMTFVLTAFPSYKVEELEDESFFSLARKVALAEQVLKLRGVVTSGGQVGFELEDPDAVNEEAQPEAQDKHQETLNKLMQDMDKAMSYATSGMTGDVELERDEW